MTLNTTSPMGANDSAYPDVLPVALRRPRLRRQDAGEYLDLVHGITIAVATLATLATRGGGPGFQKHGRAVLYPREELDKWAEERLGPVRYSTSESSCDRG